MIAFVFPGQGAQAVGMGRGLVDRFPVCRSTFDEADAALGFGLSEIIFDGPAERLTLTEIAQPAILTVSVAACRLLEQRGVRPALVAGHSLGEYSAHVAAGTFTFADAVRTVHHRGRFMQAAVPVGEGAMAAVLGLDEAAVSAACAEVADGQVVSPANLNAPGQVVIAGHAAAVARAGEQAKARGARRVIALQVSAPFHCALMRPAEERLAPELRALPVRDPHLPVMANVDAEPKRDADAAIAALIRQVSAPVRWEDCVRRLTAEGATVFVEVGPGTVLSGLIRKIARGATTVNLDQPAGLGAVEAIASVDGPHPSEHS
jgi:[acyl-carrier-protein] S-malonyltransferase